MTGPREAASPKDAPRHRTAGETEDTIGRGIDRGWILAGLLLLAADGLLTAGLYLLPAPLALYALGHLLVCGVAGLWVYRRWLQRAEHSLPLILVISTLFMGPVATTVLLFVYPYFLIARRRSIPFEEWYRSLFPEERQRLPERLYESILRHEVPGAKSSTVVSFMDVIRHGARQHKFAVIALIARHFRPTFAPVLKVALNDEANEIRVQAATAISKITDDFARRMQDLEEKTRETPDDPDALEALARTYDDFSFSGILDSNHAHNARTRALDLWLKVAEARPDDRVALVSVGRLLMRLGRYGLAADWMERAMAEDRASPQMIVWYMECLFQQGRIDELRAFAASRGQAIEGDRSIAPRAVAAVQLWQRAGGGAGSGTGEPAHA